MRYDEVDHDDWNPDERAELDALRSERAPSAMGRARTIRALHERGLLATSSRSSWRRMVTIAAAAAVVFMAGAAAGYIVAIGRVTLPAASPVAVRVAADPGPAPTVPTADLHVVWF
jgi:hypothetical protein